MKCDNDSMIKCEYPILYSTKHIIIKDMVNVKYLSIKALTHLSIK